MPRTQRLIVASLALIIGLGLGFFLSGIFDFQKLDPVTYSETPEVIPLTPTEREFKVSLDTIMRIQNDVATGGYTPNMLMAAFPGLQPEDFDGAAAIIGDYRYSEGILTYTNTDVLDGSADNLSDEGVRTMKNNVYRRLSLSTEKDVIEVIQLLKVVEVATSTTPIILPANNAGTVCPQDAKLCPDGSSVGRTGLNCEFAACGEVLPTPKEVTCTDAQREVMCTQQYQPVCASYQVQCVTTPCNPIPKDYGNACSACSDKNVSSYQEGQCAATPL